jgi:hypothetical protein
VPVANQTPMSFPTRQMLEEERWRQNYHDDGAPSAGTGGQTIAFTTGATPYDTRKGANV